VFRTDWVCRLWDGKGRRSRIDGRVADSRYAGLARAAE